MVYIGSFDEKISFAWNRSSVSLVVNDEHILKKIQMKPQKAITMSLHGPAR